MSYKLGKLPARNAVKLKLARYTSLTPPPRAGHYSLDTAPWLMLSNDRFGDCVWAGAAHETMHWNREAGRQVRFTDLDVLSDYSRVTGFTPGNPSSDQGTDMQVAAAFRKKTGVTDGIHRHKIGAYVALDAGNTNQVKQAIYLFSAAGIGIQFPASAMSQFNAGKNWTVVASSPIDGGHYIPAVGYDSKYVYVVTWGKLIKASWGFINRYMDEGLAYLSAEMLTNNLSLEGFDIVTLQKDLSGL